MATNYPTSKDDGTSLPYPAAGNFTNSPSNAGIQDNQNDAIIAIQNKLGTGASTPSSGKFLTGTGVGASGWANTVPSGTVVGTSDIQTLTNKTLTSPTINSPTITNATISTDLITGYTSANIGSVFGLSINSGTISTNTTFSGTLTASNGFTLSSGTLNMPNNSITAPMLATTAITLGYAQITSPFTTTTTGAYVDVTGLAVTVTAPSNSRNIKITVFCPGMKTTAAASSMLQISIREGSTVLSQATANEPATGYNVPMTVVAYVAAATPGSHTYKVSCATDTAGTLTFAAGTSAAYNSYGPAFILVEAI